jgi:hypothetical protein
MGVDITPNIPNLSMGADDFINEFHRLKVLPVIKDTLLNASSMGDSTMIEICRSIIRLSLLWYLKK